MAKIALSVSKTVLFVFLIIMTAGYTNISEQINNSLVLDLTRQLYGAGNITADNTENVLAWLNIMTLIAIAALAYYTLMVCIKFATKKYRKARSR
ncbi:hypothetical protein COO59_17795 [Mixta theicola]|uniref:Uncharacterized protein n=1 Tax=Mixta theicola TaxID=1458355 RepID=A0A2K1Q5M4_9GAMM|nr:hypothetical protein [Mixta theicola]PNS10311.1 hypothetical protein COO59_17795 [Mixta theicola]GLR07286.1 hypothetical protein GCM10007905_00050 [Mixta theicola]